MNWKVSLVAAVIVIAAGGAVGVAIGGKTKTEKLTVTVAHTVTVPAQASASTTTTPASGGNSTTPGGTTTPGGGSAPVQLLDADMNPPTNDNISVDASEPRQQIGGEFVTDAVTADVFTSDNGAPATVTYSPTGGQSRLRTRMGFQHGTRPGADVEVEFRAETQRGRLLDRERFNTPEARSVTVPLQATRDVVIVFTDNKCKSPDSCSSSDSVTMVLGSARFTG